MLHHFSILFFIYKSKSNSKGESPINCRITLNGVRKQFTIGNNIKDRFWNSDKQRCKGASEEARLINAKLDNVERKLNKAYNDLLNEKEELLVEDIYNRFSGNNKEYKTILQVFDYHNQRMNSLIGTEYVQATYDKFVVIQSHVKDFIKDQYNKPDFPLNEIKLNFLEELDYFLKLEKGHNQNTINKVIERLKKVIKIAVGNGWLVTDPFLLYKKKSYVKVVTFLSAFELKKLENYKFSQERLASVRDCFIFSCYTGLAYNEAALLSMEHLVSGEDGFVWIEMVRQKTQRPILVPILPKAMQILKQHGYPNNNSLLLPIISNQKINSYLKEIGEILGFKKTLTHHVARKTFASTVLMNNDIPLEIVSFLLGHSKISTTELHYAKVVKETVVRHIKKLTSKKLLLEAEENY